MDIVEQPGILKRMDIVEQPGVLEQSHAYSIPHVDTATSH